MAPLHMKKILAISSEVGVGAVGLSIARYAFAAHKISTIALPTVLFASRPDMGKIVRHTFPAPLLNEQLEALANDGLLAGLGGLMTGYFAGPDQVEIVAEQIKIIRKLNPDVTIMVDPVLGDFDTGFYVNQDVAIAVRDRLLPLADIITPNLFEFLWLTDGDILNDRPGVLSIDQFEMKCQNLSVENIVVTSAIIEPLKGQDHLLQISTVLVAKDGIQVFPAMFHDEVPKGTGDVFAADLLSRLVLGEPLDQGVNETAQRLEHIADKARGLQAIEPYLLFNPNKLFRSHNHKT